MKNLLAENRLGGTQKSIARRLLVAILLCSATMTILTTIVQLYVDYHHDITELNREVHAIEHVHLKTLVESVWTFNEKLIMTQLNALNTFAGIEHASVLIDDEIRWKVSETIPNPSSEIHEFQMIYTGIGQEKLLGTLRISVNYGAIYYKLLKKSGVIFLTNGVKTFFVALFILFIVQRLLTRHLTSLASFARQDGIQNLTDKFEFDRDASKPGYEDEFDELQKSFNEMRLDLHTTITALSNSEVRFRNLLNSTAEGIVGIDAQGACTYCNPASIKLLGYCQEDELLGHHIHELIYHSDGDDNARAVSRLPVTTADGGHNSDDVLLRKDGTSFSAEIWSYPIYHQGYRAGSVVTFFDISQRKLADAQLLSAKNEAEQANKAKSKLLLEVTEHRANLEIEVRERTEELSVAKDKAEEANLAKSQFLASMSHELRTPLNAIIGFTEILQNDANLGQQARHHVDIVNKSGDHLLGLINDILDMAKIEAKKMTLIENNIELPIFLDNLVSMMSYRTRNKGLTLTTQLSEQLPRFVCTDELKLRQILLNLLSNAVKFTEKGTITINAEYQTAKDIGTTGNLIIKVEDSGHGIALTEMEVLFTPFVQTESGRKSHEGTGLGLSLCKHFVELMGGTIQVESTLGEGSVFHVTLPVVEVEDAESQALDKHVIKLTPGQPDYQILVVDDIDTNLALLISVLEPVGFQLHTAKDGQAAIDQFKLHAPDLILMDILMPVMNGKEATSAIRDLAGGQEITIIALTASALEQEQQEILDAGCNEVMLKPFRVAQLFKLIEKYLNVTFLYEENTKAVQTPQKTKFVAAMLQGLSKDWLDTLLAAAIEGDVANLRLLLETLPDNQQALKQALREHIDSFEFETITNVVMAHFN